MNYAVLFNWQRLGFGADVVWIWPSQCECGKGHFGLTVRFGPFRLEVVK